MELATAIILGLSAIAMGGVLIFYGLRRRESQARPTNIRGNDMRGRR